MKRRKHTPDQVVRKLREADRLLADGKDVAEVAKHLECAERYVRLLVGCYRSSALCA